MESIQNIIEFRGGKNLTSLTASLKPKKKKISAWVKGRKSDIHSISGTIADQKDVADIPGYDPHKYKFVNLKNIESGLKESGVLKDAEEESRKKRRQEAGFTDDADDHSIIDIESLHDSDGEGVTFRELAEDDKINKMNAGKTPRTGRMTSFSRPVTRLMTEYHKEDESEYDARVSDDETVSLDMSEEDITSITVLDLDDLEKARLILKSRLFDGNEMESRIDEITEQFNNPASAKRFLMSLRERKDSFIGRDQKPSMAEDTDRQSITSDVRHSTPHIVDTGDVGTILHRPGTSWQATRNHINQENNDNQSGRWAFATGENRLSTSRSVGRSLTWDEKERHFSSKDVDRSNHQRAVRSLTKNDLPRRPHTTPGGHIHGVSPLVRINKEQTPSIYSYNFNPNEYKDIDDARLKKLLEELYKDKKFLDYVKATDKNNTKDMAQHGIDFLLWRALFWEEKGMLPQRPPTSNILSSGVRTNIPPKMYANETLSKQSEFLRSKTVL